MTDADLVARARQGDAGAFGELVDRHQSAVFRAALAVLRSRAEAEDAAQDAFLLAYRRLGTFRGDATFRTWLLSIAWRQAINRRRSLMRVLRRMADRSTARDGAESEVCDPIASVGACPENAAAHAELLGAVREEIRSLPAKLRDALLLAQSGEYSYQEISAMVKAPTGTVKWRVSEARRIIRQRLRERGHEHVAHA